MAWQSLHAPTTKFQKALQPLLAILIRCFHLQLLRLLGLRNSLHQSAFKACAEEVESWSLPEMSPGQRAEALETARALVKELSSNPALQGTSLFSAIRDIAFVPSSLVCFSAHA